MWASCFYELILSGETKEPQRQQDNKHIGNNISDLRCIAAWFIKILPAQEPEAEDHTFKATELV